MDGEGGWVVAGAGAGAAAAAAAGESGLAMKKYGRDQQQKSPLGGSFKCWLAYLRRVALNPPPQLQTSTLETSAP